MMSGAWGNRFFAASVGTFYDWAMKRDRVADAYLRAIVGDGQLSLLGAMDVVTEVPDGSAILDVPCGGGVTLRRLRPGQRVRYVAADFSPTMLQRARRQVCVDGSAAVEFVECDVAHLPFAEGEFDLVLCFSGLHCFHDPAAAVGEIARCMRFGGRLIADVALSGQLRRTDAFMAVGRTAGVFGPSATEADVHSWFTDAGLLITAQRHSGALIHIDARRPERPISPTVAPVSR